MKKNKLTRTKIKKINLQWPKIKNANLHGPKIYLDFFLFLSLQDILFIFSHIYFYFFNFDPNKHKFIGTISEKIKILKRLTLKKDKFIGLKMEKE